MLALFRPCVNILTAYWGSPTEVYGIDLERDPGALFSCFTAALSSCLTQQEGNTMRREKAIYVVLQLVLLAVFVLPCALAQETTAGFQGTVKDPSGGLVPNATIEVSSPALIGTREVATDSGGNYRFAALPPGEYAMTVTAPGFRTYKQSGIQLSAGRLPVIEVRLEVGAVAETVEVSSEAVLLDTTQSKVAVTVERDILDNIPKGRSFQTLIP